MTEEQKNFVRELIDEHNYLGAGQYVREIDMEMAMRSARMGTVVEAVIRDLDKSRSKSDRERVIYLRSVLAWLLKDYPGLASIYREQLRIATGSNDIIPELARGFRNVNDVVSGKKSVQEGVEDAAEPLEGLADQAGKLLNQGLNQLGDFFGRLNAENPEKNGEIDPDSDSDLDMDDGQDKEGDSVDIKIDKEGDSVDIKIEDADHPLPHDIQDVKKDK